ncbi:MAG: hypothetical protein V4582_08545 [Pseudomonadota bacterium]
MDMMIETMRRARCLAAGALLALSVHVLAWAAPPDPAASSTNVAAHDKLAAELAPRKSLALDLARRAGMDKAFEFADAKPWPGQAGRVIAAYASAHDDGDEAEIGTVHYDLDVRVFDRASAAVLQSYTRERAIVSDTVQLAGLSIDTANYAIKSGVRAFGVRAFISRETCAYYENESLELFEVRGAQLRNVFSDTEVRWKMFTCTGGGGAAITHTLAIAASSSHGYQDLRVSELQEQTSATCAFLPCADTAVRRTHLLRFDGNAYPPVPVPPRSR